jgi:hypothetical protein
VLKASGDGYRRKELCKVDGTSSNCARAESYERDSTRPKDAATLEGKPLQVSNVFGQHYCSGYVLNADREYQPVRFGTQGM